MSGFALYVYEGVFDFVVQALTSLFDTVLLELAFPDDDDMPAFAFELFLDALVSRLVARELLLPELHVALGFACVLATLMRVPKTAMLDYEIVTFRAKKCPGESCLRAVSRCRSSRRPS